MSTLLLFLVEWWKLASALQPGGERLKAGLLDWLPAYEAGHRRRPADVREALLAASRATLDRLLIPARVAPRRRAATRPGSLLRAMIPLRTEWPEQAPGYLEMDGGPVRRHAGRPVRREV